MKKTISIILVLMILISVFSLSFSSFAQTLDGWVKEDIWWFYYENGSPVEGWKKIDGKWYYFTETGVAKHGVMCTDRPTYTVTGVIAYFKSSGELDTSVNGWKKYESRWYYIKNGCSITGWKKIDGKWYLFDKAMITGYHKYNEKYYYFNSKGVLQTGWSKVKNKNSGNTEWIYSDKDGVIANTIWKKINNKWYYFSDICKDYGEYEYYGGYMVHGCLFQTIDNGDVTDNPAEYLRSYYYFNDDGTIAKKKTGWLKGDYSNYLNDNVWYYLKNGKAVSGWQKINGSWYYLNLAFLTAESTYYTGIQPIDGKNYLFDKNGKWNSGKTGWVQGKIGLNYSQYNAEYFSLYKSTWFYFENGVCNQYCWKKIKGKWYYFNFSGMVTGSETIDGVTYYFDDDGVCLNP